MEISKEKGGVIQIIKKEQNKFRKIIINNDGLSGCLIFAVIVLVLLVVGGGWLYLQWSNIREIGLGKIQEVIKEIEKSEKIDNIKDIDSLEDLEKLDSLNETDIEKIKEMAPLVKRIYRIIPQNIIDRVENNNKKDNNESLQQSETPKLDKSENELLPESVSSHPAFSLQDYQEFKNIPGAVLAKIDEEYINEGSVLLEYETDFPARKIEELRQLEKVPENISDSQIEEKREELEQFFNLKEVLEWHEERLTKKGWGKIGKKTGYANGILFEHPEDGYFMILGIDTFLYTP